MKERHVVTCAEKGLTASWDSGHYAFCALLRMLWQRNEGPYGKDMSLLIW